MDIPDLVREHLGDEEIRTGISLGEADVICFTPARFLVYRSDGLLSDEGVTTYPLDFERLDVSEGRRKTKFQLSYVDGNQTVSVPATRSNAVLERLIEGALRVDTILESDERVTGVFRFSELTLVVAEERLLKHIGEHTWSGDFERFSFDRMTGLQFEEGSVATAVVFETTDRRERIKAPNEQSGVLRRTLEGAVFSHHDVDSLDELNRLVTVESNQIESTPNAAGFDLDAGIDPLVSDSTKSEEPDVRGANPEIMDTSTATTGTGRQSSKSRSSTPTVDSSTEPAGSTNTPPESDELSDITDQLSDLTESIEEQNRLLTRQQRMIEQLVEELRRSR